MSTKCHICKHFKNITAYQFHLNHETKSKHCHLLFTTNHLIIKIAKDGVKLFTHNLINIHKPILLKQSEAHDNLKKGHVAVSGKSQEGCKRTPYNVYW